MWLKGIMGTMDAEHGMCILRKADIPNDHRVGAARLGVTLITEDEFQIYADATLGQSRVKTTN